MGFYDIEFSNCYQLTFNQAYKSQLVINRFFYQANGPVTDELNDVIEAMCDALLPTIENIQVGTLAYDYATLLELFDTRQSVQFSLTGETGLLSGDGLPAFFGARWRLSSTDSRLRKGRKIFAGITEGEVDGDALSGTYTTEFAAVGTLLAYPLVLGDFTFTPVLLSPANTRHTGNLIVPIYHAGFAGWSTQGSRKVGRGA